MDDTSNWTWRRFVALREMALSLPLDHPLRDRLHVAIAYLQWRVHRNGFRRADVVRVEGGREFEPGGAIRPVKWR